MTITKENPIKKKTERFCNLASKRQCTDTDYDSIPTVTSLKNLIGKRIKYQFEGYI